MRFTGLKPGSTKKAFEQFAEKVPKDWALTIVRRKLACRLAITLMRVGAMDGYVIIEGPLCPIRALFSSDAVNLLTLGCSMAACVLPLRGVENRTPLCRCLLFPSHVVLQRRHVAKTACEAHRMQACSLG